MGGGAKAGRGPFFEDFRLGQSVAHAPPRTVSEGDVALYTALYGARFALQSSRAFARSLGLPAAPVDDLLVFHLIFGRTVADISRNAVANLGYADGRFGAPVYAGDTLTAASTVIGLRETAKGESGIVYVRTTGTNQRGESVLEYVRWVLVPKRGRAASSPPPAAPSHVPDLPEAVPVAELSVPPGLAFAGYDTSLAGAPHLWEDYAPGERLDHGDGVTVEEAEHALATRLYHNTARVHFDRRWARDTRFGRRVVYGGHVISVARALSWGGLANACKLLAINGGRHVGPVFAGDTLYAWSEVLERLELPGRTDTGALRLRTVALKDRPAEGFPCRDAAGAYDPAVVLDLDYTVLMPRRGA